MNLYITLIITSLILFTGCSKHFEDLKPNEKKLLYKNVKDEINLYKQRGDISYDTGYYADAIAEYKMVNFYEGKVVIPLEKIEKITIKAKANSKLYYDRALKYIKKDKKRALIELSKMMKNDPNHEDGKRKFEQLKNDYNPLILSLENALQTSLLSNKDKITDLQNINKALNKLIKYDSVNPLVTKVKKQLLQEKNILINEAIDLYNKDDLEKAAKKFKFILSLYKKDSTADKYILMIKNKQYNRDKIRQAKKALKAKEYIKAIKYANNIIHNDKKNTAAKQIIDVVNKYCKKLIGELILDGETYYNNQNLDKALKMFQEVLLIDPQNNTAQIYIQKIQRQLKTIKSLE